MRLDHLLAPHLRCKVKAAAEVVRSGRVSVAQLVFDPEGPDDAADAAAAASSQPPEGPTSPTASIPTSSPAPPSPPPPATPTPEQAGPSGRRRGSPAENSNNRGGVARGVSGADRGKTTWCLHPDCLESTEGFPDHAAMAAHFTASHTIAFTATGTAAGMGTGTCTAAGTGTCTGTGTGTATAAATAVPTTLGFADRATGHGNLFIVLGPLLAHFSALRPRTHAVWHALPSARAGRMLIGM